jgi:hypothetical protein
VKKSDAVVRTEGAIAVLIPFLTTFTAASVAPSMTWQQLMMVFASAAVAGLSGLKSFLSTTFSDSITQPETISPKPEPAAPESGK